MTEKQTVLLVDGSNLAFRMYFALERTGLTSPSGKPSWAIFGFFKGLLDVIEKYQPSITVAVFDAKEKTFRHEAFDYYKANRPPEMPEALQIQWGEILRGLDLMGIKLLQLPGYEADDLIGTLAIQSTQNNYYTYIYSGDRDVMQLVDDHVSILYPSTKGLQFMDRDAVITKMGVPPEQIIDFKALCGDSSDNIPGVKGVGEKTAIKLLSEYETLDNIYTNLPNISGKSLKTKLSSDKSNAYDSQFLATIKTNCPIAMDYNVDLSPNIPELRQFLDEYKLQSLQKRLPKIFPELNEINNQEFLDLQTTPNTPSLPKLHYQTIETQDQLVEFLAQCSQSPRLSLDLETTGLDTRSCDIVGWSMAYPKDDNIYSAYIPSQSLNTNTVAPLVANTLNTFAGQLFIQNIKFEYKILRRYNVTLPANTLDTMLASYIENPEQLHNLKAQSLRVFQYQMTEITELIGTKKSKQISMFEVPLEKIAAYACDDANLTLALGQYYLNSFSDEQKNLWLNVESPLAHTLSEMELSGISIDLNQLNNISIELQQQIDSCTQQILNKLQPEDQSVNLSSPQQLAQILQKLGYKLTKKTSSGTFSTDISVLEKLQETDEEGFIELIMKLRGLNKLHSTYVESLQSLSYNGKIHTDFNQALTSTGRLSSSNPNLQNIPIKNPQFSSMLRQSFTAEIDKCLICADYSQIELRILAHFTGDPILLEAFNEGQDIHTRTAAEIFNVPINEVSSHQRQLGKTLNFALLYQQGAYATANQLDIPISEAQTFINQYFATFKSIKPFMHETISSAAQNGFTETFWKRRRYFHNLNSDNLIVRKAEERAAFNAPIQGSAADLIKLAMLAVDQNLKKLSPHCKIILQVHDELIVEAPTDLKQATTEILKESMLLQQPFKVPLKVSIGSGDNWAMAKT